MLDHIGARLTLGYNKKGYPVYYFLDFFEEELDAHICLRDFNNKSYDLRAKKQVYDKIDTFAELPCKLIVTDKKYKQKDMSIYTYKEVYEDWKKVYFPTDEEKKLEAKTHKKTQGKLSSSNARQLSCCIQ